MTSPVPEAVTADPVARWAMVGILLLFAAGYFVFLYALYARVSETDGYIQEFVEESLKRNSPVTGTVIPDSPDG